MSLPRLLPLLVALFLLSASFSDSNPRIPRFEESPNAGLDMVLVSGDAEKRFLIDSVGGGLGVIDYNRDGWMDLYIVNGGTLEDLRSGRRRHRSALYRNNRDGTFSDVTGEAGVEGKNWGKGVLVADFDNDGFDDLYVTNYGPNVLYRNQGDGTFTEVTARAGLGDPRWSSAAAAADYDLDGDLDIFVVNYLDYDVNNLPVEGKFCFYRGIPVACGPRGLPGAGDALFRNNGDGTFTDVSKQSAVADDRGYYGLGAVWGDYDNDGDPDLYVANDTTPNYLYRNDGQGSFSEVGVESGVAYSEDGREQAGMGVDWEDYDNDGWLDLVVTNFSHDYNTIYRNSGNGFFSDISIDTGLAESSQPDLSWGVGFYDFNNDGWKDLFIANGHIYPQVDQAALNTSYHQPNRLYLNDGSGKLIEVSRQAGGTFQSAHCSRGAAFADFNNDGAVDIAVAEMDDKPTLLINQPPVGRWLMLHLQGTASNRNAAGARITVQTSRGKQIREIKAGSSFASSNDLRAHFGLDEEQSVSITVRWPSGKITRRENVKANQIISIRE